MRKIHLLIVGILVLLLTAGCNQKKLIIGWTTEVLPGPIYIVENGKEQVGIRVGENTGILSVVEGVEEADIEQGTLTNIMLEVSVKGLQTQKEKVDGIEWKVYEPEMILVTGIREENAMNLKDGTVLDMYRHQDSKNYYLKDGTELLQAFRPTGPAGNYVSDMEQFEDLPEKAQVNIQEYFDMYGLQYDVEQELERAYEKYQKLEDKTQFETFCVSRDTTLIYSNENIVSFLTSMCYSNDSGELEEVRLGTLFQRETGKHINNMEAFVDSEELLQALFIQSGIEEEKLVFEMKESFQPEYVSFWNDYMEIAFPTGTLPSQEHGYSISVKYQDIEELLQPGFLNN